jgi:hypothetical protein
VQVDEAAAEKAESVGVEKVEVKVGVETAAEVRVGEVMAEVEMVEGAMEGGVTAEVATEEEERAEVATGLAETAVEVMVEGGREREGAEGGAMAVEGLGEGARVEVG